MSYRRINGVETFCDGCKCVKKLEDDRLWTIWQDNEGNTKHNCPDCVAVSWAENPG